MGMPIIGITLEREKVRQSTHPDESDFEAPPAAPSTLYNGPYGRAGRLHRNHEHTRWGVVGLPDAVAQCRHPHPPLGPEHLSGAVPVDLGHGEVASLETLRRAASVLPPGRPWGCYVVGGMKPTSGHRFRVRCRNWYGASQFSVGSVPCTVSSDRPEPVMAPMLQTTSPWHALVYWIEPCANGEEVSQYQVQCRRLWVAHPEDSDRCGA